MKTIGLFFVAFILMFANTTNATCVVGDVIAPTKVTNLQAMAVNSNGIIYSFTNPIDTSGLSMYDVRVRSDVPITALNWASSTQVTGEPTPTEPGATQTANLSGLTPGATYSMGLKVTDDCGKVSILSNVISFTTSAQTKAQVVIEFTFTPPPDKVLSGYKISYGGASVQIPSGGFAYTILIDPGTYNFTMNALYADGSSSPTSPEFPFTVQ